MSDQLLPAQTAGIYPEKFSDEMIFSRRKITIGLLIVFLLVGFGLRVWNLGAESLSEDELNKLQTVADYRRNGLSGRNGEHPFLMKGLQTASVAAAERWNDHFASGGSERRISEEAALRFPTALIGTLTILLLFLLFRELFGGSVALFVAGLWAFDPNAVAFDRVAKEDSFLLFFFLTGNFLWIRAQTQAERGGERWLKYTWAAAFAFGAMFASKYLPHILAVAAAYYYVFQKIPATRWRLGKTRWLAFFVVMGVAFVIFNPTILIPDTWREMLKFGSEKRIGHDSYEFMGALYRNQATAWLAGVPWTFYYVFIFVKTPLVTLAFALAGVPLLFKRRFGDGRYFVFFWALMWFLPFTFLGGKFTRYFAVAQPLVFVAAAIGLYLTIEWIARKLPKNSAPLAAWLQIGLFAALIFSSLAASLNVTPHFRLQTNALGGGAARAGNYFPHDEFYDASAREIVSEIAARAHPGATVANETPGLFAHYAQKVGRADLNFVSLSEQSKVGNLAAGDFVVAARGRRYFSNDRYWQYLSAACAPVAEIRAGSVPSARVYQLDEKSAAQIRLLAETVKNE